MGWWEREDVVDAAISHYLVNKQFYKFCSYSKFQKISFLFHKLEFYGKAAGRYITIYFISICLFTNENFNVRENKKVTCVIDIFLNASPTCYEQSF